MRLSDAERRFVHHLVPEQAERVLQILAGRSDVLVAIGAAAKPRGLGRDLKDWFLLAARLMRGAARTSPLQFFD